MAETPKRGELSHDVPYVQHEHPKFPGKVLFSRVALTAEDEKKPVKRKRNEK